MEVAFHFYFKVEVSFHFHLLKVEVAFHFHFAKVEVAFFFHFEVGLLVVLLVVLFFAWAYALANPFVFGRTAKNLNR